MTQTELNRAVAQATGESVSEISHLGFEILEPLPDEPDPEDLIVDWDTLQLSHNVALYSGRRQMAVA